MEAQVWTLIGLLGGALFGMFFYLGGRIDALGEKIGGLTEGVGSLESRFDVLDARFHDHIERHTG